MNNKKPEENFIPCGDALEKMDEIRDDDLENVSGGYKAALMCGWCGGKMDTLFDNNGNAIGYRCKGCGKTMGG